MRSKIPQNFNLFLTITLVLLLAYNSTIGSAKTRHDAIRDAFGAADARQIEAKIQIAEMIPRLLTADFYSKDTAARVRIANGFWRTKVLPAAARLDPDYVREFRRKFFKAAHA